MCPQKRAWLLPGPRAAWPFFFLPKAKAQLQLLTSSHLLLASTRSSWHHAWRGAYFQDAASGVFREDGSHFCPSGIWLGPLQLVGIPNPINHGNLRNIRLGWAPWRGIFLKSGRCITVSISCPDAGLPFLGLDQG